MFSYDDVTENEYRKVYKVKLPSYWACAIINGDDSSMEKLEIKNMESILEELNEFFEGQCNIVDCGEETYFLQFNGLPTVCLDYTVYVEKTKTQLGTPEK